MSRCHDAAFEPGDPSPLVRAAFACPVCLREPATLRLVDAFALPVAEATCPRCALLWQVELTLPQALRLVLDPPDDVALGPQARALRALADPLR